MNPSVQEERPSKMPDWAIAVVVAEVAALAISLVMALTSGRTGSEWSFAQLFVQHPTLFEKILTVFVFTNLLFLLFGLAVFWKTKSRLVEKTKSR